MIHHNAQCHTWPDGWRTPCLDRTRGDQAIGNASVAGAFAYSVDAWVGHGLHGVGDHDAAVAVQTNFSARPVLGRMPAAMTTRSAATSVPSLKRTALTRPSAPPPRNRCGRQCGNSVLALPARCCNILLATSSSWRSISQGAMCHHRHVHAAHVQAVGGFQSQQAAPITTAFLCVRAVSIMVWVSAMSR